MGCPEWRNFPAPFRPMGFPASTRSSGGRSQHQTGGKKSDRDKLVAILEQAGKELRL
jgi:hypothetical protein